MVVVFARDLVASCHNDFGWVSAARVAAFLDIICGAGSHKSIPIYPGDILPYMAIKR